MPWKDALLRLQRLAYVQGTPAPSAVASAMRDVRAHNAPWTVALGVLHNMLEWPVAVASPDSDQLEAIRLAMQTAINQSAFKQAAVLASQCPSLSCDSTTVIAVYRAQGWDAALSAARSRPEDLGVVLGSVVYDALRHNKPHDGAYSAKWAPALAIANSDAGDAAGRQFISRMLAETSEAPSQNPVLTAADCCRAQLLGNWDHCVSLGVQFLKTPPPSRNDGGDDFSALQRDLLTRHSVSEAVMASLMASPFAAARVLTTPRKREALQQLPAEVQSVVTLAAICGLEASQEIDSDVLASCCHAVKLVDSPSLAPARHTVVVAGLPLLIGRTVNAGLWQSALSVLSTPVWNRLPQLTRQNIASEVASACPPSLQSMVVVTFGSLKKVRAGNATATPSAETSLVAVSSSGEVTDLAEGTAQDGESGGAADRIVESTTWERAAQLLSLRIQRGRLDEAEALFAARVFQASSQWKLAASMVSHCAMKPRFSPQLAPLASKLVLDRGHWFAAAEVVRLYDLSRHRVPSDVRSRSALVHNTFTPLINAATAARRWQDALCLYREAVSRDDTAANALGGAVLLSLRGLDNWHEALGRVMAGLQEGHKHNRRSVATGLLEVLASRDPSQLDAAWAKAREVCPAATAHPRTVPRVIHALASVGSWATAVVWLQRHKLLLSPHLTPVAARAHVKLNKVVFDAVSESTKFGGEPGADELLSLSKRLLPLPLMVKLHASQGGEKALKALLRCCLLTGHSTTVLPRIAASWAERLPSMPASEAKDTLREMVALASAAGGRFGELTQLLAEPTKELQTTYAVRRVSQWAASGALPAVKRVLHRLPLTAPKMALSIYCSRHLGIDLTDVTKVNNAVCTTHGHTIQVGPGDLLHIDVTFDVEAARRDRALLPRVTLVGDVSQAITSLPFLVVEKPSGSSMDALGGLLPSLPLSAGRSWTCILKLAPNEDGLTVWFPAASARSRYSVLWSFILFIEPIGGSAKSQSAAEASIDDVMQHLQKMPGVTTATLLVHLPATDRAMVSLSADGHYAIPMHLAALGWRIHGDWYISSAEEAEARQSGPKTLKAAFMKHHTDRGCFVEAVTVDRRGQRSASFTMPVTKRMKTLWTRLMDEEREGKRHDENEAVAHRDVAHSNVTHRGDPALHDAVVFTPQT